MLALRWHLCASLASCPHGASSRQQAGVPRLPCHQPASPWQQASLLLGPEGRAWCQLAAAVTFVIVEDDLSALFWQGRSKEALKSHLLPARFTHSS